MAQKVALVAGASGIIGSGPVDELSERSDRRIRVLACKPIADADAVTVDLPLRRHARGVEARPPVPLAQRPSDHPRTDQRRWREIPVTDRVDRHVRPAGRMLMQMLGSFTEFEREMIPEHTRAGLHEARAQRRVPGRKPKITAEQRKEIVEAVSSERKTPAEIARLLKIHRATVSRIVAQARAKV